MYKCKLLALVIVDRGYEFSRAIRRMYNELVTMFNKWELSGRPEGPIGDEDLLEKIELLLSNLETMNFDEYDDLDENLQTLENKVLKARDIIKQAASRRL